jgi:DNA ligase-1
MSGFTDEFYKSQLDVYSVEKGTVLAQPRADYVYSQDEPPRIWFDAICVWELRGATITISPKHKAAAGMVPVDVAVGKAASSGGPDVDFLGRGLSLRFPRFVRVRDDKSPANEGDVTTSEEILDLYCRQAKAEFVS